MTTIPKNYPYAVCRDMRHRWSREVTLTLSADGRTLLRIAHCDDCPVVRTERFGVGRRGTVVAQYHSRYLYPKDYPIKGGASPSEFRFAGLTKALTSGRVAQVAP